MQHYNGYGRSHKAPKDSALTGCATISAILAGVVIVGTIVVIIHAMGSGTLVFSSSTTSHGTTPTISDDAVLGADIAIFTRKYGTPSKVDSNGTYSYGKNLDVNLAAAQPPYDTRVIIAFEQAPNNDGWSTEEAVASCEQFAPSDSKYQRQENLDAGTTTVQRIYKSMWLAQRLPTKEFIGGGLVPTEPGTFGIVLSYDGNRVLSCSAQVELQG